MCTAFLLGPERIVAAVHGSSMEWQIGRNKSSRIEGGKRARNVRAIPSFRFGRAVTTMAMFDDSNDSLKCKIVCSLG